MAIVVIVPDRGMEREHGPNKHLPDGESMTRLELLFKTSTLAVAAVGLITVLGAPREAFAAQSGCTDHIYECERQDMPHINANCQVWQRDDYTGIMTCIEWKKMPATYYMYTPPWP